MSALFSKFCRKDMVFGVIIKTNLFWVKNCLKSIIAINLQGDNPNL